MQSSSIQVVTSGGSRCWIAGNMFVPGSADKAVAAGHGTESYHDATDATGTAVRVYTRTAPLVTDGGQGLAISVSAPLSQVSVPLERLALILTVVAGIGVLGATTAGLWVARAGLRPVDRLTDAVEHIARTEDLAVRIPVEGEDEIARLSASFNSMTAALASSRDRQQQLIADAGHELRTPLTSPADQRRAAGPQRGDRPAHPAGRPPGAAGVGEGADGGAGRAHRRPPGAVAARRGGRRRAGAGRRRSTRSPSTRSPGPGCAAPT